MTRSRQPKRRRCETSVSYITDSTEEDSASDEQEYHHKSKGKEKLQQDEGQDTQDEEEEEEGWGSPQMDNIIEQVCGICLTEEEVERGKLDCCDHYFCFGCIMEWAKVESRCPTCKQRFVTIVRPPLPGVPRSRPRTFHIPHRNQVYEPSEEEIRLLTDPYQHTVCSECQEAGDERLLLLCDGCDAAAHTYCVGLGRSVPRGDWFCNSCSAMHLQGFSNDDQEHEDEPEAESSSPLLPLIVSEVQPLQRRQPPRRAAAPRLNWAGGRHTRLHPAPPLPQDAQALILFSPEGAFDTDEESPPTAARTLSQQRIIRQRVNDLRNHWNQLQTGELQITPTSPRRRTPQAEENQLNDGPSHNLRSAVPEGVPRDNISQGWSMVEQARASRGVVSAYEQGTWLETRASRHRGNSYRGIPIPIEGTSLPASPTNQSREHISRRVNTRESNRLVGSPSRGHRGSRRTMREDGGADHNVHANSMQELRISEDSNEGNVGMLSPPGRSRRKERGPVADRSARRAQSKEGRGSHPPAREEKDTKDHVLHLVKAELKPLFQLGHIDKKQHKKVAWSATQTLLAAFGLEHRGPETRAFGSLSSACTHLSSSSTSTTFLPNCCSQCLRHHVHKVVASLVKRSVGIRGL